EGIVETLEHVPGLLSYFNLELPGKRYGNLVLCAAPDVPARWHAHELHRVAVALAPRHYHSARLHRGVVRSPLLGDGDLVVLQTPARSSGSSASSRESATRAIFLPRGSSLEVNLPCRCRRRSTGPRAGGRTRPRPPRGAPRSRAALAGARRAAARSPSSSQR